MCESGNFLSNRVAIVTGSSSGLGREIAVQLGRLGAAVVVNYLENPEGGELTAVTVREGGGRAITVQADVGNEADVKRMVSLAIAEFGRLDIVVSNAGFPVTKYLQYSTDEDWDSLFNTNLRGGFHCARECFRLMRRARWGRIIFVGSAAGALGGIGQSMYAASKAGLLGLTRSIAREGAPFGITVNLVAPGFMEMEMGKPTILSGRAQRLIPLGRFARHSEVAAMVVHLCGDEAGYITGQQIFVDGGLSMS